MKNMRHSKAILSFLFSVFAALIVGGIASSFIGISPLTATGAIFGAGALYGVINHFSPMPKAAFMAIQQEIWVDYIMGNLFKDNSFLMKCFDESDSVLAGSVVHIPQAGAKPTVVKNRSSFPATAVRRTDTDITYALDVYTTDPTHIPDAETKEISYNKIDSVLSEHVTSLEETYADNVLYTWAPTVAGNILRTTGAADNLALAPSATGTRNAFIKGDLRKAQKIMNKQKVPKEDRYALIPTDMLSQILDDTDLVKRDGLNGGEVDLKNGIVARLYGFAIMERSDTTLYDATPAPKTPAAAGAATDNQAAICWQKNYVAKAVGSKEFFQNIKDALYYGDVYSAQIKLGSRKRRTAGEGVVAIVQA